MLTRRLLVAVLTLLAATLSAASRASAQAPPPTGVTATAGNAQVSLSWNPVSYATGYHVKRSTTSGGPYTTVGSPTTTSYTDTGLTNGTTYYYVVTALGPWGETGNSTQVSATPTNGPPAPTGLTATAGDTEVVLSWNTVAGASTYNVKRSTANGGPYSTVGSPTTNGYTDTGLTDGTTYYYVVSAVVSGVESSNSAQASATPQGTTPTGLTATGVNQEVNLAWNSVTGATSYNVKRSLTTGGPYTTIGSATTNSASDAGVTNGTTYYYVVSAIVNGLEGNNSAQASATPEPPPPAPAGLTFVGTTTSQTSSSVELAWTASSGGTSYNVKRASASTGPFSTVGTTSTPGTTSNPYVDSNLSHETTYYYIVTATNASGESFSSNEVAATTMYFAVSGDCGTPPPQGYQYVTADRQQLRPVSGLTVTQVSYPGAIQIEWAGGGQICHYHYLWTRSGGSQPAASGVTSKMVLNDDFAFTPGTTYTYAVQVISDTGTDWTSYVDNQTHITWYNGRAWDNSPLAVIQVIPQQVTESDNQAVDARYDTRYATYTYLNFNFGNNAYKGGLFVGYSTDPARVGRSFLKFNLPALPSGAAMWVGSLNAYCVGTAANTTSGWQVGAQTISNNSWSGSTINWSNAPTIDPTAATLVDSVTYTSTDPASYWCMWPMTSDITNAISSGQPLSVALADKTESTDVTNGTNTWCYFAKGAFSSTLAPTVLYVYGPPQVSSVVIGNGYVPVNGTANGTVTLVSPAPAGGAVVNLSSSYAGVSVPSSVTVSGGATSASFTASAGGAAANQTATITATYDGSSASGSVTTTPAAVTVSFNPTSVGNGVSSTGTVTLNGPAPAGGAVVQLSNSNTAALTVPASVTIAAGTTIATFTVTGGSVSTSTLVTVTATYWGTSANGAITVTP